ncbi:MAG: 50S ribosomal protein L29 [Parcubacteria group bacterium]|nr:MAG: 50S ribosomal protein L29 [Parcubacteria group bacterium]
MKVNDIRKIVTDKLQEQLIDLRKKTREMRFSLANNQLKNVREARRIKKDVAKILTVLNERRQAEAKK